MQKSELFFDDIIIKTYHTAYVPGEKRRKKFGFKTKSDKEHFCKIGANSIAKKRIIISDKNPSIKYKIQFTFCFFIIIP